MENYDCKCGLKFDTLAELQAHWADPERDKTKPHYRDIPANFKYQNLPGE